MLQQKKRETQNQKTSFSDDEFDLYNVHDDLSH